MKLLKLYLEPDGSPSDPLYPPSDPGVPTPFNVMVKVELYKISGSIVQRPIPRPPPPVYPSDVHKGKFGSP